MPLRFEKEAVQQAILLDIHQFLEPPSSFALILVERSLFGVDASVFSGDACKTVAISDATCLFFDSESMFFFP